MHTNTKIHNNSHRKNLKNHVTDHGKYYAESLAGTHISSSSTASGITRTTATDTNSSLFPKTASIVSDTVSDVSGLNGPHSKDKLKQDLQMSMERLNLLEKYNGVSVDWKVKEHGKDHVKVDKKKEYVQLKPKLNKPVKPGKFARWFQVIDPNASIRDDIKMARGVLRRDRFQTPSQLDNYLGLSDFNKKSRHNNLRNLDKDTQYRVKKVRNKLKHWNSMFQQLKDAIASVEQSSYKNKEKAQHVDQICSIYIGRSERAIDYFYSEPAAHYMLDMVLSLQKKVAESRHINQSYQGPLSSAIV